MPNDYLSITNSDLQTGEAKHVKTQGFAAMESARTTYLRTIGLALDPFATPVAEQELALSAYALIGDETRPASDEQLSRPSFFAYYTPPSIKEGQTLLQRLRQPLSAFIYGPPGAGKTALRLILEADIRSVPEHTLVVSYILSDDVRHALTPEQHWNRLRRALAIDLFVQIVEQFNPLSPPPTPQQIFVLRNQLALGGHALRRLVMRLLDDPEPKAFLGLGMLWPAIDRTAVRYVSRSESLIALIKQSLPKDWFPTSTPIGPLALQESFQAARLWGFERIFLLIDGLDTRQRTKAYMMESVNPLLEEIETWQVQSVFPKFFLPIELQSAVQGRLSRVGRDLHFSAIETKIRWDEASLQSILIERFRAARSRRLGFDDLAGPGLEGKLDALILRAANGSPRRLLQIVSSLMDSHAVRDPYDLLINLSDWDRMRGSWGYELPPPLPVSDI